MLAFSLHELAKVLGPKLMCSDLIPVLMEICTKDIDEVKIGALSHLADFFEVSYGCWMMFHKALSCPSPILLGNLHNVLWAYYIRILSYSYSIPYAHICTHVHVHTCTHLHVHTCTHVHVHTCTHVHVHTCTHVHVHTCAHVHVHTCTHMHIHTCTHTCMFSSPFIQLLPAYVRVQKLAPVLHGLLDMENERNWRYRQCLAE